MLLALLPLGVVRGFVGWIVLLFCCCCIEGNARSLVAWIRLRSRLPPSRKVRNLSFLKGLPRCRSKASCPSGGNAKCINGSARVFVFPRGPATNTARLVVTRQLIVFCVSGESQRHSDYVSSHVPDATLALSFFYYKFFFQLILFI